MADGDKCGAKTQSGGKCRNLKAIRCDWGAVQYVQGRLSEINQKIIDAAGDKDAMLAAVTEMGLWQNLHRGWVAQSAKHSKMALDAGVQERQIRLSEMIGA
jgi:hypothetical protein